jgi:hypothetical protein
MGSQLVPSALDVLHPGRVAILFEGGQAAVTAQLRQAQDLVGGAVVTGGAPWDDARSRQAAARGVVRFAPGELRAALGRLDQAVVRAAAGVAYVPEPVDDSTTPSLRALQESVRARFDPAGVLA